MKQETVWLIEGRITFWSGRALEAFTDNPEEGVRFCRCEDAERVIGWIIPPALRDAVAAIERPLHESGRLLLDNHGKLASV